MPLRTLPSAEDAWKAMMTSLRLAGLDPESESGAQAMRAILDYVDANARDVLSESAHVQRKVDEQNAANEREGRKHLAAGQED